MARFLFGGGSDDYAVDSFGRPVVSRRVRFYTSTAMTTEITDLASDGAGTGTPLTVTTDTHGFWGPVYGPDGTTVMYAGTVDRSGNPPAYVVAVYTHTSVTGGVTSFNTRSGPVTLSKADVTGTGLAAADVGADASGAAATVQTNLTTEVTRAQAAEAALGGGMQFRTAVVVSSTNQALTSLPTVDGVTLTAGQVILLTGQSSGSQNGLWAVASGAWARPSNFAAGLDATGTSVLVESGTAGAGTTYAVTGTANNVVGTNVLTFVKTSGSAASGIPAGGTTGQGLTKHSNTDGDVQWSDLAALSNANPQPLGTAGPGTSSAASRDDHVHPQAAAQSYGAADPGLHGLKAWFGDPLYATGNFTPTAGQIVYAKVRMAGTTISSVVLDVGGAGATVTGAYVGVYDGSGTRVAISADISTTLQSTGIKTIALTGAPISVTNGNPYVVALLVTTAGTMPVLRGFPGQNGMLVLGQAVSSTFAPRLGTLSGQSALPSTQAWTGLTASDNAGTTPQLALA